MRWAVVFVIAGCYGPTPIIGALCASPSAAERCPTGQLCVAVGGEERCQLTAPNDAASDGPVDAADNCPMIANVQQANEDGDAFGDVCDPCPPSATGNADSDGDGVGDACDPSGAAEHIAQFVGFANGLPAGWTAVGNFTAINGNGVAVAGAGGGALRDARTADGPRHRTRAFDPANPELGVRVRSGSARYHWIMVVTRPRGGAIGWNLSKAADRLTNRRLRDISDPS